jgi:RNA polymerase sigma-32 factor
MNGRLRPDVSLNALVHENGEAGEWQDWLVDPSPSPDVIAAKQEEDSQRREALSAALALLTARERRVFEARHLSDAPTPLEELAAEYGVSRERVDKSTRAFRKVAAAVTAKVPVAD